MTNLIFCLFFFTYLCFYVYLCLAMEKKASIYKVPKVLETMKVSGAVVSLFLDYIKVNYRMRQSILNRYGLCRPEREKWYPLRNYLLALKELEEKTGSYNLFLLGRKIVESVPFPSIRNLYEALDLLDVVYHINHSGGNVGHYLLVHYSPTSREASIECSGPYPDAFDYGILTALVRKYKPKDSLKDEEIFIDIYREVRSKGGSSTTFIIKW